MLIRNYTRSAPLIVGAGPELPRVRKSWQGTLEKQGFSALLRTRTKIHRGESL
jgi:hypothetical protein